jgi:hypothetical protein
MLENGLVYSSQAFQTPVEYDKCLHYVYKIYLMDLVGISYIHNPISLSPEKVIEFITSIGCN